MRIPRTLLTIALWTGAWVGVAGRCDAQQNLFNVPSGQITKRGELFFQQQFNFAGGVGTSNTTVDVGVGRGWEVGFNFLDLQMYQPRDSGASIGPQQVNPDLLVNLQKGFEVADFWNVGVGTQIGGNPSRRTRDTRFLNFTWVINQFEVPEREEFGKWYVGAYSANKAYAGPGDSVGFLLGAEVPIVRDKLSFQFDWVGGRNDLGVAVVGGVYTFPSGWQLSLGAQLPAPRSDNPYGVVLEFTYPGFPLRGRAR